MNDARFKRKKHGHLPGDLSKHIKIAMREKRGLPIWAFDTIAESHAKAFRHDIKHNQRAQLKVRHLKEMENEYE